MGISTGIFTRINNLEPIFMAVLGKAFKYNLIFQGYLGIEMSDTHKIAILGKQNLWWLPSGNLM